MKNDHAKLTRLQELVARRAKRTTPMHFDKEAGKVVFGGGLMDSVSKLTLGA